MKKKQPRPKKKFLIDLVSIRKAIGKAQKVANRSVTTGKQLTARSRKDGRTVDTKKNKANLNVATKAKAGLVKALAILKACCGNTRYNSDPEYF